MFGFRRSERPPVQLYGKLPLAKDYLRLGLGEGAGLRLREWLDATFSAAASREEPPKVAWPARFLLGDAWQTCLQGVIVPSTDAGGHRPFPFALCVERRRKAVVEDLAGRLAEAGGVWAALRQQRERCVASPDGRSMLAAQRGAVLEIPAAADAPASAGIDVDDWLEAVWPGRGRAGLEGDLGRLCRLGGSGPIRLPLAAGCSQRLQVQAWLEILERAGLVPPRSCPTIFFPESGRVGSGGAGGGAGFLTVFRGGPSLSPGSWLTEVSGEDSLGPADLAGGRPAARAIAREATEGLPPLAASLRATVAGVLRRLGPGVG